MMRWSRRVRIIEVRSRAEEGTVCFMAAGLKRLRSQIVTLNKPTNPRNPCNLRRKLKVQSSAGGPGAGAVAGLEDEFVVGGGDADVVARLEFAFEQFH